MVWNNAFAVINRLFPAGEASAHCDIPCGIYDPHAAQIAALTVLRMNQLINNLQMPEGKDQEIPYENSLTRYIDVKEEHAEICKREIEIIWSDYFKPEHLEKFPDLHQTVWNALKLASKNKQEVNLQAAEQLVESVNKFAETFWASKGSETRRQPSLQTVGGELVFPVAQ